MRAVDINTTRTIFSPSLDENVLTRTTNRPDRY